MAIAQMNWGRMKHAPDDPRLSEFMASLDEVYALAEAHPGFIWRIPDDAAATGLAALGYDNRISATVSVWTDVHSLRDYTFNSLHGTYLERKSEWFEVVDGPQLVIWDVATDARPDFAEAFAKLDNLRAHGDTPEAYGWPKV